MMKWSVCKGKRFDESVPLCTDILRYCKDLCDAEVAKVFISWLEIDHRQVVEFGYEDD